jgi:hypothetical protein
MNPQWLIAAGDLMMGGAAWVAGWVGLRGLDAWRTETVGRRRAELAEEVLTQFYRVRDIVAWARFPAHREPADGETEGEVATRRNAAALAPVERLASQNQVFSELQASRYRFMAHFGEEAARPFEEIRAVQEEIVHAAGQLARAGGQPATAQAAKDQEGWAKSVGWGDLDTDALAHRLDRAIKAIEQICRPLIAEPERRRRGRSDRRQVANAPQALGREW